MEQIEQPIEKKLRLRSNNAGKSNILRRVSTNFDKEISDEGYINEKRKENGLDKLSGPKITELIIKHKKYWRKIKDDIIHYNTELDEENKGDEFNER